MSMETAAVGNRRLAAAVSVLPGLLGLVVIYGWLTHDATLIQLSPAFVPMQFNTALCFLLCGVGLFSATRWGSAAPLICAAVVAGIAVPTLSQDLFGLSLGIDQVFLTHYITTQTANPGRMAPNTALNFILASAGLILISRAQPSRLPIWILGILGAVTLGSGVMSMVGYAADLKPAYKWGILASMAAHTAVGFITIGVSQIAHAWGRDTKSFRRVPAWFPLVAGIMITIVTLSLWQALNTIEAVGYIQYVVLVLGLFLAVMIPWAINLMEVSEQRAYAAATISRRLGKEVQQRRQVEQDLRESETRFRAAVDGLAVGSIIIDEKGTIELFNSAAERLFGYSSDEIIGRSVNILMPDADKRSHDSHMRRYRETGEARIIGIGREVTGLRKGGEAFPMHLSVGEIRHGAERKYVAAITDLTEIKQLETQLVQAQKMEAVGTLAGGIAHDFNNILTGIMGHCFIAEMKTKDNTDVQKNLAQIQGAAERAKTLVQQLLTFGRHQEIQRENLDLGKTITEAISLVRPATPVNIKIHFDPASQTCFAYADSSQILQVLVNLLTNSAQAIDMEAGDIHLGLESIFLPLGLIGSIGPIPAGNYVKLTVRDSGRGMDEHTLARIYDPFFTTKPAGVGTGLGLAAVHGIIGGHGGTIEVRSRPEFGTTFAIYLPETEQRMEHAVTFEPDEFAGSESVLMVDDSEQILEPMSAALESLGYRVETARDSCQALQRILDDPGGFDLVITDQVMPEMSGGELAKGIKQCRPDLPVILYTAYRHSSGYRGEEDGNIDKIILKPAGPLDLAREIRALLDVPRPVKAPPT